VGPENKETNFQNSGIEMIKGWESLQNELPGAEKPEVPGTENPKAQKNESFENPKIAEPNESSENLFESKCLLFLFVLAYKCCGLFLKV
jgi:hypothetical protein